MREFHPFKYSPLTMAAMLSVALLILVTLWRITGPWFPDTPLVAAGPGSEKMVADPLYQQEMILLGLATSTAAGAVGGEDPVEMIAPQVLAQLLGKYTSLIESGSYTPDAAADAASEIAPNVRALVTYVPHEKSAIKTTTDTSYKRMLEYRAEMQNALQPLLSNTDAEYAIYASYVETGDATALAELTRVAKNYSTAADAAMQIEVPQDALDLHLEIVNALAHFSATINSLALHADDPIGSVALLRTYNDTELALVTSFDKFAQYGRSKLP